MPKIKIGSGKLTSFCRKTRQLELAADSICHKLYYEADSTFITPIDREDIHLLAHNLDNIIDFIENLTSNLLLYKVTAETPEFKQFVKRIKKMTSKIFSLVSLLAGRDKNIPQMKKIIIEINSLENEGDKLIRRALKNLFANHKDPIFVIKWKDLFETMEEILDEGENTANIVDQIIVKNF